MKINFDYFIAFGLCIVLLMFLEWILSTSSPREQGVRFGKFIILFLFVWFGYTFFKERSKKKKKKVL